MASCGFDVVNHRLDIEIEVPWARSENCFIEMAQDGILEGINSLIQAAKADAKGYHTMKNLIMMIYLVGGKLEFRLLT